MCFFLRRISMKRLCTPSQTCSVILQVELGNLSTSLYKAGSHWINCWQKHWRITMKSTRSWTLCFLTTPCNMCKLKKPISLVVFFKGTFSVWQVRVHSGMKVNYFPAFYSHMVGLPSISSVSWRLPPLMYLFIQFLVLAIFPAISSFLLYAGSPSLGFL